MTNQEWIDMLQVLPLEQQNQIVLVLKNQSEVAVDTLFRFERNFLVLRGRVAGTTDEGRAFFIPFDQMVYFRIERVVNLTELDTIFFGHTARSASPILEAVPAVPTPTPTPIPIPVPVEPTAPPTDATATRNALLDRIRAARATQSG